MAVTISVVGYGRYVGTGKVEQEFVLYRDRTDGSRTIVEVFLDKEPVLGLMLDLKSSSMRAGGHGCVRDITQMLEADNSEDPSEKYSQGDIGG